MKKFLLCVPVVAAALLATACGAPPPTGADPSTPADATTAATTTESTAAGDPSFKACMVSDSGGFDDKSFNETSYKGLTDAVAKLGIQHNQVESKNNADYAKNIDAMITDGCNTIITVGFLLNDATVDAATAHPEVDFAIVDSQPETTLPNLKPLAFNTAQSSFMAGYLAAGMTETGTVGTFGGARIPTVTIFMDGFAQGVAYHNESKGTEVKVIGWDTVKQDGSFVPGDNPFENVAGGKQVATNLVSQGADILFPVAGPAGLGGLQVAQASGGDVNAIWVDTDGCVSAEEYCSSLISSVEKSMDVAVAAAIEASYNGEFSADPYVGTLDNGGTALAPFHEFDDRVPAELKAELDQIKADIIAGTITIESESQPQ